MPDVATTATDVALAYQAATKTITGRLSAILALIWRGLDPWSVEAGWEQRLPEAVGAFTAAQEAAAGMADGYVSAALGAPVPGMTVSLQAAAETALRTAGETAAREVLARAGVDRSAVSQITDLAVDPGAFAGRAASGLSLENLLSIPAARAQQALTSGMPRDIAMGAGEGSLKMYATTEIHDAARLASQASTVTHRAGGYIRVVGAMCCSRCAILAGRWYRYSAGFERHPNCFPAGTIVSGPQVEGATRRWFEGELVTLTTASGQQLSLTGNHPVLTSRGWVPANLLQEGDEVVRSTRPQGATALIVPDHDEMPAPIEDVWGSHGMRGLTRVPTSAEDFHGDGGHGEVDIAPADRTLGHELYAPLAQHVGKLSFPVGLGISDDLVAQSPTELVDVIQASAGSVGSRGAGLALFGSLQSGSRGHAFALGMALDAVFSEYPRDYPSADSVLTTESVLGSALPVSGNDVRIGQDVPHPRWDAPPGQFSVEKRPAYASRGRDLLDRLAGQVEVDRLVLLRRIQWSGHVYSVQSSEGWHSANGLIVSNCRCINVPVSNIDEADVPDPMTLVREGRVTDLTRAEKQAIDLGADLNQVINSKQGLYIAGGHQYTTAGTTRRGVAGARILARDIARAGGAGPCGVYANYTVSKQAVAQASAKYGPLMRKGMPFQRKAPMGGVQTVRTDFTRTGRLSVSEILKTSTSHDDAVRMLLNHGYVLSPRDAAGSVTSLERLYHAS